MSSLDEMREWRRTRYESWPTDDVTISIAELDLLLAIADERDALSTPPADDEASSCTVCNSSLHPSSDHVRRALRHAEMADDFRARPEALTPGILDGLLRNIAYDVRQLVSKRYTLEPSRNSGQFATPPADDVREAIYNILRWGTENDEMGTVDRILAKLAEVRSHGTVTPSAGDVREALEATWDDGNATGLDGWVGPGRGTSPIDPEAVEARRRAIEKHGSAFEVSPHGTVADAEVEVPALADDCECEDREALVRPEGLVCGTCGKVIKAAREVHP